MTVGHVWVGGTTPTSARVIARVSDPSARLAVDLDPALLGGVRFDPVAQHVGGIVHYEACGLEPNTQYRFAIEDGAGLNMEQSGTIQTFPVLGEPASYMFAGASCAGIDSPTGVSDGPVFKRILNRRPIFFPHGGDLHYKNISTNDPSLFRAAYDEVFEAVNQAALYRNISTVYLWDDHCFGPNNSYGLSASAPAAQLVYRERVPHHLLSDPVGIYQSFGIGRVLFIGSDVRSFRSYNLDVDGPSKVMLGAAQKAWMLDKLINPGFDAEYLVWLMPSQWMGLSTDSWAQFTYERAEIVQMLGDTGWLARMCIVSGDIHALAIDSGGGNQWGGFPVFQFAALDGRGTEFSQTQYDLGPTLQGGDHYGTVRIHDLGAKMAVTGIGYAAEDMPWKGYTDMVTTTTGGIDMLAFPPTESHEQMDNEEGFSNTSWAPGQNLCWVVFTAAETGKATVSWSARMETKTSGAGVLVGAEVRLGGVCGEGTPIMSANDSISAETAGTANANWGGAMFRSLSGLIPGQVYHARLMHKVTAGSANIFARQIKVNAEP